MHVFVMCRLVLSRKFQIFLSLELGKNEILITFGNFYFSEIRNVYVNLFGTQQNRTVDLFLVANKCQWNPQELENVNRKKNVWLALNAD